jgi:hypothetical protein
MRRDCPNRATSILTEYERLFSHLAEIFGSRAGTQNVRVALENEDTRRHEAQFRDDPDDRG